MKPNLCNFASSCTISATTYKILITGYSVHRVKLFYIFLFCKNMTRLRWHTVKLVEKQVSAKTAESLIQCCCSIHSVKLFYIFHTLPYSQTGSETGFCYNCRSTIPFSPMFYSHLVIFFAKHSILPFNYSTLD